MTKTLRILGTVAVVFALGMFVGCSDDSSTPVKPQPAPMGGVLGVYADAAGANPNITDTGGLVTVYVVHTVANGATASQFRVEAPAGWTLQTEQAQFTVALGNVANGVSLGYGNCMAGAIHMMTLTYMSPGTSTGSFRVLPHTDAPEAIQVVDCSQNLVEDADGASTPVN